MENGIDFLVAASHRLKSPAQSKLQSWSKMLLNTRVSGIKTAAAISVGDRTAKIHSYKLAAIGRFTNVMANGSKLALELYVGESSISFLSNQNRMKESTKRSYRIQ